MSKHTLTNGEILEAFTLLGVAEQALTGEHYRAGYAVRYNRMKLEKLARLYSETQEQIRNRHRDPAHRDRYRDLEAKTRAEQALQELAREEHTVELRRVDIGLIEGSKAPLACFPLWMLTFADMESANDMESAKEEREEEPGDSAEPPPAPATLTEAAANGSAPD